MHDHNVLVRTVSEFVAVLVGPYDVEIALHHLVEGITSVLGLSGAAVSVSGDDGLRPVTTLPPALVALEDCQLATGEGPCMHAYATGEIVAVTDLATVAHRWPRYVTTAREAQMSAAAGVPLAIGGKAVGVLSLYCGQTRDWSARDLQAARLMADIATAYLINAESHREVAQLNEQLRTALETRVVIEQAKGVIAEARGITVQQAFELIRRHARGHNVRVHDVAEAVVNVGLRL